MGSFVPPGTLSGYSQPTQSQRYDNLAHFSAKIMGKPEMEPNLRRAFASQHILTGKGELKYERWAKDMKLYGYRGHYASSEKMGTVVEGGSR